MPSDVGVFSVEDARAMYAAFRELTDLGIVKKNLDRSFSLAGDITKRLALEPINVYNDSGFVVPPYGLMQSTITLDVAGSKNYIKVKRPIDSTLMRSPLLVNGPREIEVDGYGTAQNGPVYRLLHDGGTYVPGDRLGFKTGGFTASYGALYSVLGADDIDTNIVRVMFDVSPLRGQTISTLVVGTPGLVYLRDAAGNLTSRQYPAEAEVSNITGSKEIMLFPTYGKLLAMEIC